MTAATIHKMYHGPGNPAKYSWSPFEWVEPEHGPQVKGEVAVVRPEGTSGSLSAGFWRTGPTSPGCNPDGSCRLMYSAPLGDETVVLIEGSATLTVVATGKQYEIEPGSIVSHPKGLDVTWEIKGPYLKKFWVVWDSPLVANPINDLYVGNINDDPDVWEDYTWTEPAEGEQTSGELYVIRPEGATGTLMAGIWRTGVGIAGCAADGSSTIPYTSPLGDETMLLLEGQAHLRIDETGEEFEFRAGDVVALPSGLHCTWTSKGPFMKKFWVITNANLPA